MKKQSRILTKGSKSTSVSQRKTSLRKAEVYPPPSQLPCIALFPEGDGGVSEEIIDLSKAEYAALKQAVAPSGDYVLMFMANTALQKIGWPGSPIASRGGLIVTIQPPDGTVCSRVAFSSKDRARIEVALKRTGLTLAAFMERALERFLAEQAELSPRERTPIAKAAA